MRNMIKLRRELILSYSKKIKKSLETKGFFITPSPIGGFIKFYMESDLEGIYSLTGIYSSYNGSWINTSIMFVAEEMAKNHFRKVACRSSMSHNKATWLWYNIK